MRKESLLLFWLLLCGFVMLAPLAHAQSSEVPVTLIELAGPAADADAEISGLTWYGDTLLLVAENPNLYASAGYAGAFFTLDKAAIVAYLASDSPAPLEPEPLPILSADIPRTIPGFDGFEAAVVQDDTLYLLIEAIAADGTMRGYLVSGALSPDGVTLDLENRVELLPQTDFFNTSYESLLIDDNTLLAFYEANGAVVNPDAEVYRVSPDLSSSETIPFLPLEYRLTDVTQPDANGLFWGINYFYPGDDFLAADTDPLADPRGSTHENYPQVERLVAFQLGADGITLADADPIWLELEGEDARNWEGIERLDDRGFLLVTDKYPQTLLGFVPLP
ncbi:MAG TPA: hypothetical protein VHP83_08905 [Aggregatilineaceae bacterium]|nr:hypothetical protein [Aggregatilineaceae bacterium]